MVLEGVAAAVETTIGWVVWTRRGGSFRIELEDLKGAGEEESALCALFRKDSLSFLYAAPFASKGPLAAGGAGLAGFR